MGALREKMIEEMKLNRGNRVGPAQFIDLAA
jgi:hypothetical protein